jgi:hypothetical protein
MSTVVGSYEAGVLTLDNTAQMIITVGVSITNVSIDIPP